MNVNPLLTLLLLVLSILGYALAFARRFGACFAPLLTMCAISLGLYLFALVGSLTWGSWLMLLLGPAAGVTALCWHPQGKRRVLRQSAILLLFGALCFLLFLRYHGSLLVAYDDFSHWGLIVRHLLSTNRLPTSSDTLIAFQSYPPGAALWIYWICRFTGGGEGTMLTAQAALTLSGFYSLLALTEGRGRAVKTVGLLALLIVGLSLFQGSASLMVDNLVAALGVGALSIAAAAFNGKLPLRRSCLGTALVCSYLCIVKDSGLFFAAAVCFYVIVLTLMERAGQKRLSCIIPPICAVAVRGVWQLHLRLSLPSAGLSRHALSADNLRRMGSDKSYGDMAEIGSRLVGRMFSLDGQILQILIVIGLGVFAVMLSRRLCRERQEIRGNAAFGVWAIAVSAAYAVMLWITYCFTFQLSSALELVAVERYSSTCALFLYGALAIHLLTHLRFPSRSGTAVICLLLWLPLVWPSWRAGVPRLFHENYYVPLRAQMQEMYEKRPLAEGEKAVWVLQDESIDPLFAGYMAKYTFYSDQIGICMPQALEGNWDVIYLCSPLENQTLPDAEIVTLGS